MPRQIYCFFLSLVFATANGFLLSSHSGARRITVVSADTGESILKESARGVRSVKVVLPSDSVAKKRRRRHAPKRTVVSSPSATSAPTQGDVKRSTSPSSDSHGKLTAVKEMITHRVESLPLPHISPVGWVALALFPIGKVIYSFRGNRVQPKKPVMDDEMARFNDLLGGNEMTKFKAIPSAEPRAEAPQTSSLSPPAPPAAKSAPSLPKKAGLGLFKRKQDRPIDLEDILSVDGAMQSFNRQLVSHLAAFAPGRFDEYVVDDAVDLEEMVASGNISKESVAESIAQCVNAMLILLVDQALATLKQSGKGGGGDDDDSETVEAVEELEDFMANAGGLFEELASGAAIKPVKYGGKAPKKKLEDLFGKCVRKFEGDSIDNLQRVLGIKDAAAERIASAIMMEQMTDVIKDMSEEEVQGLMGGGDPSALLADTDDPAAAVTENFQEMIDVLKVALAGSDADRDVARKEIGETFGAMGLDLKTMADMLAQQKDPQSKELTGLFKQLLDPSYKPPVARKVEGDDDLLGI